MAEVLIPREVDRFVLYFETPRRQINAVALATSLVGLADAVREANAYVNPGYQVEVVVEALEGGSFKAIVKTIYNQGKNLFSTEPVKAIVYGIIATYLYQNSLAPDMTPKIIIQEDMVIIETGDDRVVVPKDVFDAKERLEKSERFRSSVSGVIAGAGADTEVSSVGMTPNLADPRLLICTQN